MTSVLVFYFIPISLPLLQLIVQSLSLKNQPWTHCYLAPIQAFCRALLPVFPWSKANFPLLSHSHIWLRQNINLQRSSSLLLFWVDKNILDRVSLHLLLPPFIKKRKLKKKLPKKNPQLLFSPFISLPSPQPFLSILSHKSGLSGVSMSKCTRTICMWVLFSKKSMFYNLIFSSDIKPAILCVIRVINAESDFIFLTLIPISTPNANNCDIRLYKNYQAHQLRLIKPFKSCFCYI